MELRGAPFSWEDLNFWVENEPNWVPRAIAVRTALRVLPIVFHGLDRHEPSIISAALHLSICNTFRLVGVCSTVENRSKESARKLEELSAKARSYQGLPDINEEVEPSIADAAVACISAFRTILADDARVGNCLRATVDDAINAVDPSATEISPNSLAAQCLWESISHDCFVLQSGSGSTPEELMKQPLWKFDAGNREEWPDDLKLISSYRSDMFLWLSKKRFTHSFFARWYRLIEQGEPIGSEVLRRISSIEEAEWSNPHARAEQIARVEVEERLDSSATPSRDEEVIEAVFTSKIPDLFTVAILSKSLIAQIQLERERVRSSNSISSADREIILVKLSDINDHINQLNQTLDDNNNHATISDYLKAWGKNYSTRVSEMAKAYANSGNIAEATLATAIILGCTALGNLIAPGVGAIAGAAVGGLISNQVKPGDAAKKIANASSAEPSDPA